MPADLPLLLKLLIPSTIVGLAVGLSLRYFFPEAVKKWGEEQNNRTWWHFGLFAIMFAAFGLISALNGDFSFAVVHGLFVVLQVVVMFMMLAKQQTPAANETTPANGAS